MRGIRGHAVRTLSTMLVTVAIVAGGASFADATGAAITLTPNSGLAGSTTQVTGSGYAAGETVKLAFINTSGGVTNVNQLGTATADSNGAFQATVKIPSVATPGSQKVRAVGRTSHLVARKTFFVTT